MNDKTGKGGKGGGKGKGRGPSLTSGSKAAGSRPKHASSGVSPKSGKPASARPPARRPVRRVVVVSKRTGPLAILQKLKKNLLAKLTWSNVGSLAMTFSILFLGALIYFAADLPDISGLGNPRKAVGIKVLSVEGDIIGAYGEVRGDYMPYDKIPKPLIDAVVATEDRNFFNHYGVDPWGIIRAMMVNVWQGRFVQGGSTITQQLAKNVFLSPERTFKRKFQEMLLAFWLESRFSKQEILSIYLNRVYLGAGNFGVDAASRYYFGIPAKQLSMGQSAVIAGLLKAPSRYAPSSDAELSRKRAHQVLLNMVDAELITQKEADKAFAALKFPERLTGDTAASARFFSDWVIDSLSQYMGNVQEDLVVQTTLRTEVQHYAESAVEAVMTDEAVEKNNAHEAAFVAMQPDGAVLAMIGGRDYHQSQYNRAVQAERQPGSSFKMFVYLTAMEAGYTPDSLMEDRPVQIGKWRPTNYKNESFGTIPLKEAVSHSVNTIAVQLGQAVGISRVINTARRLGIKSKLPATPSLALGAGEVTLLQMTGAYAHLANNGHGVRPYAISEIRRQRDGKLLFKQEPPYAVTVIGQKVVVEMNSMLSGVLWGGTGRSAAFGRSAAGKTGTTSDYKDAWFIGYTPQLVAGAWVGNDDSKPMNKVTGGTLPAAIWRSFMSAAHKRLPQTYLPVNYQQFGDSLPWSNGADGSQQPAPGAVPVGEAPMGDAPVSDAPADDATQPAPATQAPAQPQLFESPPQAQPAPAPQPAPAQRTPRKQQGEGDDLLGPQFWDKLFDKDKMEYSYPGAKPQR